MMDLKHTGRNVTIFPEAQLVYPENISIGDESMIDGHCFLYAAGDGIEIGSFCHVTVGSHLQSGGKITFEDFSACGAKCIIMAASDDYQGEGFIGLKVFGDKYRRLDFRPVTLKRHAHVGAGTIILPGVTIGEGCSVGAGSIVTHDLPPWTICVGSPAKPVREKPREKQLAMEKAFLAEYEKKNRVLVSVSVLTYNQEKFLEQCLDSIVGQITDFPFEVIVHDDASTDKTPAIIREYATSYPDIVRPIFQTTNQFSRTGVYPSAEFSFPHARGKYIAECDGDDYWTDPHKLQMQTDFLETNPDYSMCFHRYKVLKEGGQLIAPAQIRPEDYSSDDLIGYQITTYGIATCTRMFRNLYPTHPQDMRDFCGDYSLIVLMGLHGKAKYMPDIAPSVYRKHAGNSWSRLTNHEQSTKIKAMHKQLYELISAKGNERHTAIRRKFI